jgi:hypothetical protein
MRGAPRTSIEWAQRSTPVAAPVISPARSACNGFGNGTSAGSARPSTAGDTPCVSIATARRAISRAPIRRRDGPLRHIGDVASGSSVTPGSDVNTSDGLPFFPPALDVA